MLRKYYTVAGSGMNSSGKRWFDHGIIGDKGWANYINTYSYVHALRQYKRTRVRDGYSQIEVRGYGVKTRVIKAWRYQA